MKNEETCLWEIVPDEYGAYQKCLSHEDSLNFPLGSIKYCPHCGKEVDIKNEAKTDTDRINFLQDNLCYVQIRGKVWCVYSKEPYGVVYQGNNIRIAIDSAISSVETLKEDKQ